MSIPDKLKRKLAALPKACGVYLMKDRRNKVIYVGKALDLRARVRSYFHASADGRVLLPHLVPRIADIDWVIVASEKEALILENNLIKQFKPRFNINLKDDKTFLSIRLDRRQPFPRLELVRRYTHDGALYFGPYASAASARETLRIVNATFPIRKCTRAVFRNRTRPCIYHQLGRCVAPCTGEVPQAAYAEMLDEVELFLRGRNQQLARRLRQKMHRAAATRQYELAARYRDQLAAVQRTIQRQLITTSQTIARDVFAYHAEGDAMLVQALLVRRGRLQDVPTYSFAIKGHAPEAAFGQFLQRFYARAAFIPPEILVPTPTPDAQPLAEWLSDRRGSKVTIVCPKRGPKRRLVEMAARNATSAFRAAHATQRHRARVLEALAAALALPKSPERIECYDISNTGGTEAVGSQVTFLRGQPNKARYRRYRIKTVERPDDCAMMREVLRRRIRRGVKQQDLPDLLIVDGGKGQLGVAQDVLREFAVQHVPVVALAKGRQRREAGKRPARTAERLFLPGRPDPVVLPPGSPELHLVERIRDEAHRFAIAYHRKLRRRPYRGSVLDRIPGIGPARKKALLEHFGTMRAIRAASAEQLAAVPGISPRRAAEIHALLHGAQPPQ